MKHLVLIIPFTFSSFITVASGVDLSVNKVINERNCDQILDKKVITICYDYRAKGAKAVAYTLDRDKVNSVNIKKPPRFYPDKSIPAQYRTYPSDYTHNEFHADRGHLAPDADFDYSKSALHAVYSMANIIPQYYLINRKSWSKAEHYERLVASRLGQVTVINLVDYGDYKYRMKKSGIAYPVGYAKILFNKKHGFERCFYYGNNKKAYQDKPTLKSYALSCKFELLSNLLYRKSKR